MEINIQNSFNKLLNYIESENFKGYDPYDTLNSWVPFHWLGKWGPILATQFQKRNPINIRPLLGIKKDYNPKAMGLFLQAYSLLYAKTNKNEYLEKADYFFNWLKNNHYEGYSGYCWGYNFSWANSVKVIPKYYPSIVVTSFIIKGVYEYYLVTKNEESLNIIKSTSDYILNNLPVTENEYGICFSYTDIIKDTCFNASLLGAEVLAINFAITGKKAFLQKAIKAVDFVLAYQEEDGRWNYSIDLNSDEEDKQVDFHQGFVLESIRNILTLTKYTNSKYTNAILKGADFYYKEQTVDGKRLKYRWPKVYPIDIHNQAQAIITFVKLSPIEKKYLVYSRDILIWTIDEMQNKKKGSFYYRKHKYLINKIPFIRWGQAWMLIAIASFLDKNKS